MLAMGIEIVEFWGPAMIMRRKDLMQAAVVWWPVVEKATVEQE